MLILLIHLIFDSNSELNIKMSAISQTISHRFYFQKIYVDEIIRPCQSLLCFSSLPDAGGDSDTGKDLEYNQATIVKVY